ncbi:unnamed protein product [Lepeophtheirus salmonis]|uniref:(salmon louse) hypothetical protein n=1 Tax=Lepeophtheirus salmonis TaxID=72036 RepID=A0A7R8HBM3_LEPSM|nr:unnamed protein product [Lepeophtheirus salmonis]CAF2991436.1 unnamed protein product [Lepeophtheirus salmonis]
MLLKRVAGLGKVLEFGSVDFEVESKDSKLSTLLPVKGERVKLSNYHTFLFDMLDGRGKTDRNIKSYAQVAKAVVLLRILSQSETREEIFNQESLVDLISYKSFKRSRSPDSNSIFLSNENNEQKTSKLSLQNAEEVSLVKVHLPDPSSNNDLETPTKDLTHFMEQETDGIFVDNVEEVPLGLTHLQDLSCKNDLYIP